MSFQHRKIRLPVLGSSTLLNLYESHLLGKRRLLVDNQRRLVNDGLWSGLVGERKNELSILRVRLRCLDPSQIQSFYIHRMTRELWAALRCS
jgi:hypothetical protein